MPTEDFKNLTEKEFAKKLEEYNELSESNKLTINDRKKFIENLTPKQKQMFDRRTQEDWKRTIDEIIEIMKRGNYERL